MWVVYKHQNLQNGKVYIGITSQDVEERWKKGRGYIHKSGQCKIANAIKKYGWEGFSHDIVESNIDTLEKAIEREKYWIKYYDSYVHGYNMSEGGSGVNSTRWKKIYQIDIETLQIIAEFPNMRQAGKAVGDYGSNLRKCCMGQQRTAGGYYWCYVDQYTPDWRPPIKVDRKKDICQIDMKTLQIIKKWHGAVEAAGKLHIQEGHITACCKRKKHSIGGFYWCYAIDYSSDWKPIGVRLSQKRKVRCVETNQEFESIAAAAAQMNISKSDICECCKKRQKHTKGYHWEYIKGEKGHD